VSDKRSRLSAWLQLVRVPNLLTVPGAVVAGALLAADPASGTVALWRIVAAAAAATLLYAAGVAANDIVDRREDACDRPGRPIPGGQVSVRAAWLGVLLFGAAGVFLAAFAASRAGWVALFLVGAIVVYNGGVKRFECLGPLTMALCRALSLLMGAALVEGRLRGLPWMAAAALFGYIAVVTWIARSEMSGASTGAKSWAPALSFAGGMALSFALVQGWDEGWDPMLQTVGMLLALGGFGGCLFGGAVARSGNVPQAVGIWIFCLLPMQAAWCAWSGAMCGLWMGVALVLLWPVAMRLGQRFAAS